MPYIGKSPTAVPLSASDLNDDIISLAKLASGTDGNLITYDASGNPVAVATGDDGQILTSAGAGQPCAFETAAASADYVKLGTETISSAVATVSFDGLFTSDYDFYTVYITNWVPTSNVHARMRFRASDAALTASNYRTGGFTSYYDGSDVKQLDALKNGGWNEGFTHLTWGDTIKNVADHSGYSGMVHIHHPLTSSDKPNFRSEGYANANGGWVQHHYSGGFYNVATALSGVDFYWNGENSESGTFTMYGVKK